MVNRLRAANSKSLNYLFPGGLGRGEGRQRIVSPDERVDEYKEIESKTSSYSVLHLRGLSTLVFANKGLSVKSIPDTPLRSTYRSTRLGCRCIHYRGRQ